MLETSTQFCNATGEPLVIWFEPWALEFELPPRAVLDLHCASDERIDPTPEIEVEDGIISVWAAGGSRIAVAIDSVDQDSFSSRYAAPDMGALSPRAFVELTFSRHPEARPGGLPLRPVSAWRRLRRFLAYLVRRRT